MQNYFSPTFFSCPVPNEIDFQAQQSTRVGTEGSVPLQGHGGVQSASGLEANLAMCVWVCARWRSQTWNYSIRS